jgi:hypothetical protein
MVGFGYAMLWKNRHWQRRRANTRSGFDQTHGNHSSYGPQADHQAASLPQLIMAGTIQTARPGFSVTSSLDPLENGELTSGADCAGRVDLHLERRTGLGRANALYLDQG